MEEKEEGMDAEQEMLFALVEREDILEKKVKIYSRLLTDLALAMTMDEIGFRHEKRKESLVALAVGKTPKKKNEQGRYATKEGEEEK